MSIFKRKPRQDAAEIAQVFFAGFVEDRAFEARQILTVNDEQRPGYDAKSHLYRVALVLMTLVSEEKGNSKFAALRESFEALVLPDTDELRAQYMRDLTSAMLDLSELLTPSENPKQMSWAAAWLEDIDIQETNPVTLFLFGLEWGYRYLAITETIEEMRKLISGYS